MDIQKNMIEVIKTTLDGCFLFKPKKIKDNRGYFFESYRTRWFFDIIKENVQFVQDNQSFSRYSIILNYLASKSKNIILIPHTKKITHLKDNLSSLKFKLNELTSQENKSNEKLEFSKFINSEIESADEYINQGWVEALGFVSTLINTLKNERH